MITAAVAEGEEDGEVPDAEKMVPEKLRGLVQVAATGDPEYPHRVTLRLTS